MKPPRQKISRSVCRWLGALLAATRLMAGPELAPRNLGDLSLEELMNETVTSVSKKEEKLTDAAAAVFVLSEDDLHRSGVTTVADALRLVPGVQVAALGSATWAVSVRGFNQQYANKLLVMIDGRTIYSPLFSGVYWDAQQLPLDDVDRIEVIRGPGATIWGANATNGVINILSKSARDTTGTLLYGAGGDGHQTMGGARYGGRAGADTWYRVYANYQLNAGYRLANGQPANDRWDMWRSGFRVDHYTPHDGQLTWQGDLYTGKLGDRTGDQMGFNTLGRWTQRRSDRSGSEVQVYLDHTYRNDYQAADSVDTADLSFQKTEGVGERQDIIWGLGYRFIDSRVKRSNSPAITILTRHLPLNLYSAFVEDRIALLPGRLTFTLGTKIEHNDFTGVEVQPNARLTFKPAENQTAWAAVSRAVRTPSEVEGKEFITFTTGAPVVGPGGGLYLPIYQGNPRLKSEVLLAYELGYRIQPTRRVSVDLTTFYNDYHRLAGVIPSNFIPGVPVGLLLTEPQNSLVGESHGAELALAVAATDAWRLSASYSLLLLHLHAPATIIEISETEANAPRHQAVLRSSYDLAGGTVSLDTDLRYVAHVLRVAAYLTADLHVSWRPSTGLELSLVGQNLMDASHPEQASIINAPTIEVPRGFFGRITWRF